MDGMQTHYCPACGDQTWLFWGRRSSAPLDDEIPPEVECLGCGMIALRAAPLTKEKVRRVVAFMRARHGPSCQDFPDRVVSGEIQELLEGDADD